MGKKDKDKKKVKGAEKTAAKTEKKLKAKLKKETGEEDIESVVQAIEAEERKRSEVKEYHKVDPPSQRSSFSLTPHPDNPELILFGGEYCNGQKTFVYNDLYFYNTKRSEWSRVKSPGAPPPRTAHQAVATSQNGGQLWVFGGEFVSPNETQFYHYKDLWCYHFNSRRWEKIQATGGPSSRSGHRMNLIKRKIIVFGGFNDNGRECKYFNDVHSFDLDSMAWKKLDVSGSAPLPRSGCCLFPTAEGKIVVYGGYAKEKGKKDGERGTTFADMFMLAPDKKDETLTKWKWQTVKQVGNRPTPRTGMAVTVTQNYKPFFFGGVQDVVEDDEQLEGTFFNELHTVVMETNEKANWFKVELSGKRADANRSGGGGGRRRKDKVENEEEDGTKAGDNEDTEMIEERLKDSVNLKEEENSAEDGEAKTVTVEEGVFTITSTVGGGQNDESENDCDKAKQDQDKDAPFAPFARFGSGLSFKQGSLFLYGGLLEDGDKQFTLSDFYSLDVHKMDEWKTLIEPDPSTLEWLESSSDEEDDSDIEEDDGDEDYEDMETD